MPATETVRWFRLLHRALGVILLMAMGIPKGGGNLDLVRYHPDASGWSVYDLVATLEQQAGMPQGDTLTLISCVYAALCAALLAGWHVRAIAIALLLAHYHIYVAVPLYSYGFDYIALSALTYCAAYSQRWGAITLRALQLHLCIIYLFGGLNKLVGPAWRNGEALWKAVQQSYGQPLISLSGVEALPWLWLAAGWGVVLLELSYPFLIWWRRARPWVLGSMVLLHLAIALLMGLYAFSALMILLNLVAYHFPYSKDYVNPPTAPPEQSPAHTGIQKNIIDQTPACNTSSTSPAGAVVKKPP